MNEAIKLKHSFEWSAKTLQHKYQGFIRGCGSTRSLDSEGSSSLSSSRDGLAELRLNLFHWPSYQPLSIKVLAELRDI